MPSKKNKTLPEYDNPPLTEVVCGVSFQSLDGFIATHFGILWGIFQPDFPKADELAPLASPIEIIEGQNYEAKLDFIDIPPLPRQMFTSQDGRNVIQIQRDRFIFNWRKLELDDAYPRYEKVFSEFKNKLNSLNDFLINGEMQIIPTQYELTYVNQIEVDDFSQDSNDLIKIFPYFQTKIENSLILEEPENINSRISFLLPNKLGRLYATIRTGATRKKDNKKIVIFDLTVRGFNSNNLDDMDKWFEIAREWIVKGFTDLTSEKIQKEAWKRRQ